MGVAAQTSDQHPSKSGKLVTNGLVAFTGNGFQTTSLQHGDLAASVSNEATLLQREKYLRNRGTPHTQHDPQQFMCERKYIRLHPVLRHQYSQRQQRCCTVCSPLHATEYDNCTWKAAG